MTTDDPLVDDLVRLQRLLRWCRERRLDPRGVIEGRILVDLPPELFPSRQVRSAAVRRRFRSRAI
jgi:hypothetical protein